MLLLANIVIIIVFDLKFQLVVLFLVEYLHKV
jgi:hypothetical protein